MSFKEWKVLKSLQTDDSIMIILAGKVNKVIILDRDLYISKQEAGTNKHKPVPSDAAIKHNKN